MKIIFRDELTTHAVLLGSQNGQTFSQDVKKKQQQINDPNETVSKQNHKNEGASMKEKDTQISAIPLKM